MGQKIKYDAHVECEQNNSGDKKGKTFWDLLSEVISDKKKFFAFCLLIVVLFVTITCIVRTTTDLVSLRGITLAGFPGMQIGNTYHVVLYPSKGWKNTEIQIEEGDEITIKADGQSHTGHPAVQTYWGQLGYLCEWEALRSRIPSCEEYLQCNRNYEWDTDQSEYKGYGPCEDKRIKCLTQYSYWCQAGLEGKDDDNKKAEQICKDYCSGKLDESKTSCEGLCKEFESVKRESNECLNECKNNAGKTAGAIDDKCKQCLKNNYCFDKEDSNFKSMVYKDFDKTCIDIKRIIDSMNEVKEHRFVDANGMNENEYTSRNVKPERGKLFPHYSEDIKMMCREFPHGKLVGMISPNEPRTYEANIKETIVEYVQGNKNSIQYTRADKTGCVGIGSSLRKFEAHQSGTLWLGVNDAAGHYSENMGSFLISIKIDRGWKDWF